MSKYVGDGIQLKIKRETILSRKTEKGDMKKMGLDV